MNTLEPKRRSPILAGLLSLIIMVGLGQIYNGRLLRGLLIFLGYEGLMVLMRLGQWPYKFWGLVITLCLFLLYGLFACTDAIVLAVRVKSIKLQPYNRWYIYLAIFVVASICNGIAGMTPSSLMSGIKPYSFPSASMAPTLQPGDKIMADLKAYSRQSPQRGDLVLFPHPENPAKNLIKRLVAFGGEEVLVKNNILFIDGKQIDEPYLQKNLETNSDSDFGPFTVPQGMVFVLGDNRPNSADSQMWGAIDIKSIRGKALYIYYSKDHARIGKDLQQVDAHPLL